MLIRFPFDLSSSFSDSPARSFASRARFEFGRACPAAGDAEWELEASASVNDATSDPAPLPEAHLTTPSAETDDDGEAASG